MSKRKPKDWEQLGEMIELLKKLGISVREIEVTWQVGGMSITYKARDN